MVIFSKHLATIFPISLDTPFSLLDFASHTECVQIFHDHEALILQMLFDGISQQISKINCACLGSAQRAHDCSGKGEIGED